MRWESLFADMEAQLAAGRLADVRADVAELARAERASITLAARARASVGRPVRVLVGGADVVEGELIDAAPEWLLLATSSVRRALVPLAAAAAVDGLVAARGPALPERWSRDWGSGTRCARSRGTGSWSGCGPAVPT